MQKCGDIFLLSANNILERHAGLSFAWPVLKLLLFCSPLKKAPYFEADLCGSNTGSLFFAPNILFQRE